MLNVGFSELALIAVAALLLIRPKDYPTVIRAVGKFVRQLRALAQSVRGQVDEVMRDSGLNEFHRESITDLYGKKQATYDISDILPPADKPADE